MLSRIVLSFCQDLRHPRDASQRREFLQELQEEERLDREQLRAIQLRKIRNLLEYAYEHVPFYRRRFESRGIIPAEVKSFEDYAQIPVLTRQDIQEHRADLISRACDRADLLEDHTGGSTGMPLTFYRDNRSVNFGRAADRYVDESWGIAPDDRSAVLWGCDEDISGLGWKERLMMRARQDRFLDSFRMEDAQMQEYAAMLERWKPKYVRGYASSLALFGQYMLENGIGEIRPEVIRSAAETLTDSKREIIERAFSGVVLNFYGSREINSIAWECRENRGFHVIGTNRLIEIEPVEADGVGAATGQAILTDLVNVAMPFIRYKNGDVVELDEGVCPCGRGFPLISRVHGRMTDFIVSAAGRYIHGEYFTHLFYGMEGVESFQVHQKSDMSIDINIVKRSGVDTLPTDAIEERVMEMLGPGTRVGLNLVEHIEPTSSGKHRFTISDAVGRESVT